MSKTDKKDTYVKLNGKEWLALQWTTDAGTKLHPGVTPVVVETPNTGYKLIKLLRNDLELGKNVLPLVYPLEAMFKVFKLEGDHSAKFNQSGKDQSLTLSLSMHLPAYCEKLAEFQDAHVLAALQMRDQWAPANWDKLRDFKDNEAVEEVVRKKFGWSPPRPKDKTNKAAMDAYETEKICPRPRINTADEFPGLFSMKCLPSRIVKPDPESSNCLAELKDDFLVDASDLKTPLRLADINYSSRGFFKFACLGVCPVKNVNMHNMWRVFEGVVTRAKEGQQGPSIDERARMQETMRSEGVDDVNVVDDVEQAEIEAAIAMDQAELDAAAVESGHAKPVVDNEPEAKRFKA